MAVTETTSQGWFSRILESIKGILVGVVMFLVAVPVIFLNECSSVETAKSLAAGRGAVVMADANTVDPGKQGELVHVSAQATTDETLSDEMFGMSFNALKLERQVEMYQWKENTKKEKKKKIGGGEETVTTYTYEMVWDDDAINSSDFKETKGHVNPGAMPYDDLMITAKKVTAGAYTLEPSLIAKISAWEDLPPTEETKMKTGEDLQQQLKLHDGKYFIGASPAAPRVGDVRIGFRVVKPAVVSIVAAQTGSSLGPWSTEASSYDVELLEMGNVSADDMFSSAESANTFFTWIIRGVGWLMMFVGLTLVFRPIVVVAEFIPFVGRILGAGSFVIAFCLASAVWFVTVAVAWIAVRPLLAIVLLLGAGCAMAVMVALGVFLGSRAMSGSSEEPEAA